MTSTKNLGEANIKRSIEFARRSIAAFVGTNPNEMDAALVDLLADLMHYADATGESFDDALTSAVRHYNAECSESPAFFHCGGCECYHAVEFYGDCRSDANRFDPSELDAHFGPTGWREVEQPE